MSGPLLFIVVIAVVDIFLKSIKDKKKAEKRQERSTPNTQQSKTKSRAASTIRELRRSLEEEFEKQISKGETKEREDVFIETKQAQTPQERSREAEKKRIEKQREKVNKHSELERSSRLKRDRMLTKERLSESQSPLSSKDPNRRDAYDNLSNRKPVSIELEDRSKEEISTRSYSMINIKEDLIKGIVYSEILSKPKSLQKRNR